MNSAPGETPKSSCVSTSSMATTSLLRLRGMFALAIYDKRRGPGKEKLLLARDQLGIKPLLFARVRNSLLFASELKALIASGLMNTKIDPVSLRMLLTYGSIYRA